MTLKVHVYPRFGGEDEGDGGVRRVVEAQRRYLPDQGITLVDDPAEADVIACHITAPDAYFNNHPDKPFVAHNHGLYWAEYEWPAWAVKANSQVMELMRRSNAVTAPSEWVAKILRRHLCRPVTVINHGTAPRQGRPATSLEFVLWNKTRPDPVCDPRIVNELATLMPEQHFVTTFGEPRPNVEVTGRICYDDAIKLLRRAGIYLCTVKETFGIGTVEAMANRVPVVAWDWGGQSEILTHKKTGWLCRPGDLEGLAEGVRWCLANRGPVTECAAELVRSRYGWEFAARRYADLYRAVVEEWVRERPKVSVVVTAYKLAEYLPACLDSVAQQTTTDWECVVVDDASPDACGEIADTYAAKDDRFKVVHNAENEYLAEARNIGIAASRGRYIMPLDADDMLTPHALTLLSDALDKDRGIHVAYGNIVFLEPTGREWHSGWPMNFQYEWQMKKRNLLPYCSMYRREVAEVTAGYRRRYRTAEDADFWCRVSSYGFRPAFVTDRDVLVYRNREGSMSRVEAGVDWTRWFPWSKDIGTAPAGAVTEKQLPIVSLDKPRVAVIIPVGPGHERLVIDAIDSVEAQTYRDWECVVINDTGEPFRRALPSWVVLLETGDGPRGVAAARNLGIAHGKTELFLPLDADDVLAPRALEVLTAVYDQVGGVVYPDWWDDHGEREPEVYETPEYDAKLLTRNGCIHAVTALYPRTCWEQLGGFDEKMEGWEDWDFQLLLAANGVCGTRVPEPLFTYRKLLGTRRNEQYENFEVAKRAILVKWGRYWEGEELMGCRSCPGGGGRRLRSVPRTGPVDTDTLNKLDGDLVVVEYTGAMLGSRTIRGAVTGTTYRFDGTNSGRRKYVFTSDAELFRLHKDYRVTDVPVQTEKELVVTG